MVRKRGRPGRGEVWAPTGLAQKAVCQLTPLTYPGRRSPEATAQTPDGVGEARGAQGAATPATPQDERSAQLAWLPEVPRARSLKWAGARQGRSTAREKGAYRGVRGAGGAGRARAQVAVKFVLFEARVHDAAAEAALLRARGPPSPPPRVAGCLPAPGPPRSAPAARPAAHIHLRLRPRRGRAEAWEALLSGLCLPLPPGENPSLHPGSPAPASRGHPLGTSPSAPPLSVL